MYNSESYNKGPNRDPVNKKQRIIGLVIALLIPLLSLILSLLLVRKGISINQIFKDYTGMETGSFLKKFSLNYGGEDSSEGAKVKGDVSRVEEFSVFEKNLDPVIAKPIEMRIKAIDLNLDLVPVGVDQEGVMETPKNWEEAGWYIKGGKPGEHKNLIINGHYDTSSGTPAAFFDLAKLKYGDTIEVRNKYGRIFTYKVVLLSYLDIEDPSRLEVLKDKKDKSTLTLITCGGDYLQGEGYDKRLVVKADLLN